MKKYPGDYEAIKADFEAALIIRRDLLKAK